MTQQKADAAPGVVPEPLRAAAERGKVATGRFDDVGYVRATDDVGTVPRGTVGIGGEVVYGYPGIGRILALEVGLRALFDGPFWVEEKVDGYNVRIFRHRGRVVALTRGGFVCPFTVDRLPDLLDLSVFEREPDLVLCGEVAGPDQPYLEGGPPFVPADVQLFVFDLMRLGRPGFLDTEEKRRLIGAHGLPAVRTFGRHDVDHLEAVLEVLRGLNEEGSEGMVFKADGRRPVRAKYVTSNSSVADIRMAAAGILELPPEFFTGRILRLVLFLHEQGERELGGLNARLGGAFLDGLREAIGQFEREQKVYHTYRCRFRSRANAERLLAHMQAVSGRQLRISRRDLRREGRFWVLEFDKLYPALTGLLANLLRGGVIYD